MKACGSTRISPKRTHPGCSLWLHDWHWLEAQTEFMRSLQLGPAYPTRVIGTPISDDYGRHDEPSPKIKHSQELDPLSLIINVAVGWSLYMGAIRRSHRAASENRGVGTKLSGHALDFGLATEDGRYEMAVTRVKMQWPCQAAVPDARGARHTYGTSNRTGCWRYSRADETSEAKIVAPYFFAESTSYREKRPRSEYLERAYEEKSHWLIYLHMDPAWTLCVTTHTSGT